MAMNLSYVLVVIIGNRDVHGTCDCSLVSELCMKETSNCSRYLKAGSKHNAHMQCGRDATPKCKDRLDFYPCVAKSCIRRVKLYTTQRQKQSLSLHFHIASCLRCKCASCCEALGWPSSPWKQLWHGLHVTLSLPRHIPGPPILQRATLKNWERPGDETSLPVHPMLQRIYQLD